MFTINSYLIKDNGNSPIKLDDEILKNIFGGADGLVFSGKQVPGGNEDIFGPGHGGHYPLF